MTRRKILIQAIAAAMVMVFLAVDAPAQEAQAPQTGIFTAEFTERSPDSDLERMTRLLRPRPGKTLTEYDLADHTFQLVVPDAYDGTEDYGLLVFIHSNNEIALNRFFGRTIKDVLAKHKLIWVSFSGAGNPIMPNIRLGLALDAVHNAQRRYHIDDKRVYVSGLSGGGRMSCMAGIYYPDVFTGAIPIVGTLYFRDTQLPEDAALRALIRPEPPAETGGVWPRALFEPRARTLREMRREQRWVLLAGEKDYNMPQMRAHYEQGFERDGFEHAHYLEVPGMGHTYPDAQWYEKAVVLLDEPLAALDPANLPPADARTQRLAQRRLEVALRVLDRDRDRGVYALERLVDELPNTDAAAAARTKLRALEDE